MAEKPSGKCMCGSNDWWQRSDGGWVCNHCHPDPNRAEKEKVEKKGGSSLEVIALIDRVKTGNTKLWEAWRQIRDIEDKDKKEAQYDRWHEAVGKLNILAKELVAKGYTNCLYIEDGKKTRACLYNPEQPDWFCNTCPAQIGHGPQYWEAELMGLPEKLTKHKKDEFVEKLGGIK